MSDGGVVGNIVGCQSAVTGSKPVRRSNFKYYVWLDGELISERTFPMGQKLYLIRILRDANKGE